MYPTESSPNKLKTHVINNVTFMMPPFALLSQDLLLPDDLMCPKDTSKCGNNAAQIASNNLNLCQCTDIIKVNVNDVITIIFVDWCKCRKCVTNYMYI